MMQPLLSDGNKLPSTSGDSLLSTLIILLLKERKKLVALTMGFIMGIFYAINTRITNDVLQSSLQQEMQPFHEYPRQSIVGFWHIGPHYQKGKRGETQDQFVLKQANEIVNSYLFNEGSMIHENYDLTLNYVTYLKLHHKTKNAIHEMSKGRIVELQPTALEPRIPNKNYYELPTLAEMHAYCLKPENAQKTVFYIHSKTYDGIRQKLQRFVLGKPCVQCLQDSNKKACGVSYTGSSGWVWPHFSGNFWMTRCSHIRNLDVPFYEDFFAETESGMTSHQQSNANPPYGRLYAEYWMMNGFGGMPKVRYHGVNQIPPGPRKYGLIKPEEVCTDEFRFTAGPSSGGGLEALEEFIVGSEGLHL